MKGICVVVALGFLFCAIQVSNGDSFKCDRIYREGGAWAVIEAPECPQWSLSTGYVLDEMVNCSEILFTGLERIYEDSSHVYCDLEIPLQRKGTVPKAASVGLVAVFDGHNGKEASEMGWKLVQDFFFLHTYFLLDRRYDMPFQALGGFEKIPTIFGGSFYTGILKESLLKTIHDVDAALSKDAWANSTVSDCTATLILMVGDQILITNFGGSNVHHCSTNGTSMKSHHQITYGFAYPLQHYGKFRFVTLYKKGLHEEAVASYISDLAVSLCVGDESFKRLAFIFANEVAGLQPLSSNDSNLEPALNDIFIRLSEDSMVNTAFEEDCEADRAAAPLPVKSFDITWEQNNGKFDGIGDGFLVLGVQDLLSANIITSPIIQVEDARREFVSLMQVLSSEDKEDDEQNALSHQQRLRLSVSTRTTRTTKIIYESQNKCFNFGIDNRDKDQCLIFEAIDMFLYASDFVPAVNTGSQYPKSFACTSPVSRYVLMRRLGRGGFGKTWLSSFVNCTQGEIAMDSMHQYKEASQSRFCLDPHNTHSQYSSNSHNCQSSSSNGDYFIIKRIMVERGNIVYLSGLREKYFGEVLLNASLHYKEGVEHIARYIESLDCGTKGIWLVFRDEGVSLSKLLYAMQTEEPTAEESREVNNVKILQQSSYWHWLRTTEEGREEMRSLLWQLMIALKFCHDHNVTHRDIKPDNMVICFEDKANHKCLKQRSSRDEHHQVKMRIIDFGSAINDFSVNHLYGLNGPSSSEQTYDYSPPEALLSSSWFQGVTGNTLKYDMWSAGVVILEMILGSPNVFQLSHRTYALLTLQYKSLDEDDMKLLYKLRSFMDLCITIPANADQHLNWKTGILGGVSPTSRKCNEEVFSQQIKSRDPLKIGFPNLSALQLVRQLLHWNPEDRLGVDDALRHPYFKPPP